MNDGAPKNASPGLWWVPRRPPERPCSSSSLRGGEFDQVALGRAGPARCSSRRVESQEDANPGPRGGHTGAEGVGGLQPSFDQMTTGRAAFFTGGRPDRQSNHCDGGRRQPDALAGEIGLLARLVDDAAVAGGTLRYLSPEVLGETDGRRGGRRLVAVRGPPRDGVGRAPLRRRRRRRGSGTYFAISVCVALRGRRPAR